MAFCPPNCLRPIIIGAAPREVFDGFSITSVGYSMSCNTLDAVRLVSRYHSNHTSPVVEPARDPLLAMSGATLLVCLCHNLKLSLELEVSHKNMG